MSYFWIYELNTPYLSADAIAIKGNADQRQNVKKQHVKRHNLKTRKARKDDVKRDDVTCSAPLSSKIIWFNKRKSTLKQNGQADRLITSTARFGTYEWEYFV